MNEDVFRLYNCDISASHVSLLESAVIGYILGTILGYILGCPPCGE